MANQSAVKSINYKKAMRPEAKTLKCPHCGKGINPIYAWSLKSKGEFQCKQCHGYSTIRVRKFLYLAGLAAVVIAAIMLLIFIVTGCNLVWMLPCMLIPFFVFTVMSPFFLRFEKFTPPPKRDKVKTPGKKLSGAFSLETRKAKKKS